MEVGFKSINKAGEIREIERQVTIALDLVPLS